MSWSVYGTGKPAPLAAKLTGDLEKIVCSEPEQTIKQQVADAIAAALGAYPEGQIVRVEAGRSQHTQNSDGKYDGKYVNSLSVKIEPIYGFVE